MKAILVIDIPDDIWANKEEDLGMYAEVWSKRIDDGWCGEYHTDDLKPMPKRKEYQAIGNDYAVIKTVDYGYNKCLDEIFGGKE